MEIINKLPIGLTDFKMIRKHNFIYVDKTNYLQRLISHGQKYFLARPQGFGKSLTLSTLTSIFKGKTELFQGLAAEKFVHEYRKNPLPVLNFDFSTLSTKNQDFFEKTLLKKIKTQAKEYAISLDIITIEDAVEDLVTSIYKAYGYLVLLIDNCDYPIINSISNSKLLFDIHSNLKSFYSSLASCSEYVRFLMLTGAHKRYQTGIFSNLDEVNDISDSSEYEALVGYTDAELIDNFNHWLVKNSHSQNLSVENYLDKLKEYNKFNFSENAYIYQPNALLQCLEQNKLDDFQHLNLVKSNLHIYSCLNTNDSSFLEAKNSQLYVDKSELLIYTNKFIQTDKKYICISRPRRFGKTISANMVAAYYDLNCYAKSTFNGLKFSRHSSFDLFANKFIVIKLNIQYYLSKTHDCLASIDSIKNDIKDDLLKKYGIEYNFDDINHVMQAISSDTSLKFVVIIDEWDCILREFSQKEDWQKTYLDFLKFLFKDQEHLALVYMTGILPIKKYGTHSALNMFDEYSMLSASPFTEFVGFTETEVKEICTQYKQNFAECKRWYDGYQIENFKSIYNPRSVNRYVTSGKLRTYWNKTETYEALQFYVRMKKYGLHDTIVELLAGAKVKINTSKFSNDMRTFKSKDDVLTLLVHLGYLSYNENDSTVSIPNKEIAFEFINAIEDGGWPIVVNAIKNSDELLQALLNKDSEKVALGLDSVHMLDNSILTYNNETALAHTISLAFYAARERYTIIREFPTGKGFADLVFLPKSNCVEPIILVELKVNKTVQSGIKQIYERKYPSSLADRKEPIIICAVTYDAKKKIHSCSIESFEL